MPEKLQIPQSFKALHDAVCIHLNSYEAAHRDHFSYRQVREGFGIEHFDLRLGKRPRHSWDWDRETRDLGSVRLRRLTTRLTELVMEDASALELGPDEFLYSDIRLWDDDAEEEEKVKVPLKKRKAEASAKFEYFKTIHGEVRETIIAGLREDHLLLEEEKITSTKPEKLEMFYVDKSRIARLRQVRSPNFDLQRLIRLCEELNKCSAAGAFCASAALVRAVIDHVPPIFGARTFAEVANNIGGKSNKSSLLRLETSSRSIADSLLHQQIRKREVVPNRTQVNFSNDLDVLLGEIIRKLS
ncbi:MAG TPA: hypothetical protein VJT71_16795 [Pyrinomonadaceae bacterium]|nr:hypothetical protein [Pyrinomonadaceae bacterium]